MPKRTSRKRAGGELLVPMEWDDLIALAQDNIDRQEMRLAQLYALVRFFKGRQAAGEPCPVR